MASATERVIARYKSMTHHKAGMADQWNASPERAEAILAHAKGDNPMCGDSLDVFLTFAPNDRGEMTVKQGWFEGYGCSLCMASADLAIELAIGMTPQEVVSLTLEDLDRAWGGINVPRSRVHCMDLCLRAARKAVEGAGFGAEEPFIQDRHLSPSFAE